MNLHTKHDKNIRPLFETELKKWHEIESFISNTTVFRKFEKDLFCVLSKCSMFYMSSNLIP